MGGYDVGEIVTPEIILTVQTTAAIDPTRIRYRRDRKQYSEHVAVLRRQSFGGVCSEGLKSRL